MLAILGALTGIRENALASRPPPSGSAVPAAVPTKRPEPPTRAAPASEPPEPPSSPTSKTASAALDLVLRPAGTSKLLPIDDEAAAYAAAKRQMSRGQPKAALSLLASAQRQYLSDRLDLLEGEALLALGERDAAFASFGRAEKSAETLPTKRAALFGLLNLHADRGDHKEALRLVDLLLLAKSDDRRAELLMLRAETLYGLGRLDDAAKDAGKVAVKYPATSVAEHAERLLRTLKRRGVRVVIDENRLEIAHIRELIRARSWARAEGAIDALLRRRPALGRRLAMLSAEVMQGQNKKKEEEKILRDLSAQGLDFDEAPTAMFRLGQIAMNSNRDEEALRRFDELNARFPESASASEGEFLAGWIQYNGEQYADAARRMTAYAEHRPSAPKRPDALWFAGWSAYLSDDLSSALALFGRLSKEHATSPLAAHGHYWMGRVAQKTGDLEGARDHFREVLRDAPFTYYAFLAIERLESLNERVVFEPPPPSNGPPSAARAVALLGPTRPMGIDRAVALYKVGLLREAMEEITAVHTFLRSAPYPEGATMIVDILHALGAREQAFRVALSLTKDSRKLASGDPLVWRAWRHAYPNPFPTEVDRAHSAHKVDANLVLSIMRSESHFSPGARSPVGARGLMQLMPATARLIGRQAPGGRAHANNFRNPDSNVWLGTWYIGQLLERYDGQLALAVGAYNAGPRAMDRWVEKSSGRELDEFVESISYRETRRYVRRVLETFSIYHRLYGLKPPTLLAKVRPRQAKLSDVSF